MNIVNEIKKDRWYNKLYDVSDLNTVLGAGYIVDKPEDKDFYLDTKLFNCTPINKILNNYKKYQDTGNKKIILLSTGSYAPLHDGHINMLRLAKKKAIELGFDVLGGYLSPSHDNYVLNKYIQGKKFNIYERIEIMNTLLVDTEFDVSVWEGLYCKNAVNFTTVIDYLDKYIKNFISDFEIVYVVGSDNSDFAKVFIQDEHYCFIADRLGYENRIQELLTSPLYNKERMIITDKNTDHSSTAIRKNYKEPIKEMTQDLKYILRVGNKDNRYFDNGDFNNYFLTRLGWFKSKLKDILLSGLPDGIKMAEVNVTDQTEQYLELKRKYPDYPSISLDSCIEGDYNLPVSRVFELASYQEKPIDFNLGTFDIPQQSYWCFDDDIASGSTVKFVDELFKENHIDIKNYEFLNTVYTKEIYDIVDLRDFLIDSINSGLMVRDIDKNIRVPYVAPFVSLVTRAKILPEKELEVSKAIWQLNLELHNDYSLKEYQMSDSLASISLHNRGYEDITSFIQYHLCQLEKRI